jgi:hypothetical protein
LSPDRQAEITSLLDKVENAYCDTLGRDGFDDGSDYSTPQTEAAAIILGVTLTELLKAGITSCRKMQKVLQYLLLHSEYHQE